MKPTFVSLAALLVLSACAVSGPPPPNVPTTDRIAAIQTALAPYKADPQGLLEAGLLLADQDCQTFFADLTARSQQYATGGQLANLAGGLAAAGLGLAGGPAGALAALGVATAATSSALTIGGNATGIPYPASSAALVQQAQSTFKAALTMPGNVYAALDDVTRYANLCSLAGIENLANQAVATATTSAVFPAGSSNLAVRLSPGDIFGDTNLGPPLIGTIDQRGNRLLISPTPQVRVSERHSRHAHQMAASPSPAYAVPFNAAFGNAISPTIVVNLHAAPGG